MRAASLVLGGIVVLLLAYAGPAFAHAYVVDANPAMNASNVTLHGSVDVEFDEPVDIVDTNALEVFNARGRRIDLHDARVDPENATRVIANVPAQIAPGVYRIAWRVISADTHVVHGTYVFGVGVPVSGASASEAASPLDPSSVAPSLLRWIAFIAVMFAGGAAGFALFVLPAAGASYAELHAFMGRVVLVASLVLLATSVLMLAVQAAASASSPAGIGTDVVPTLLRSTWGHAFVLRTCALVAIVCSAFFARRRWATFAAVALAVVVLSFSLAGHALAFPTRSGRFVAVAMDFLHVASASLWIGGVLTFGLTVILLRRRLVTERAAFLQPLVRAFTPVALPCAIVTVGTGVYAAIVHVPHLADLLASVYGRFLSFKILFVVAVLAFGYRQMRAGFGRAAFSEIGGRYEALFALLVLLITAFLAGQMPPMHLPAMPGMPSS